MMPERQLNPELFNPFVPNAPSLPLKTENLKVFWCFHGEEKRCTGNKWVKETYKLVKPGIDLFTLHINKEIDKYVS